MAIRPDPAYEQAASPRYGKFLGIFESANRQVLASLFQKSSFLDAYLSYEVPEPQQVTDRYIEELENFAAKNRLELRIKHVVN